MKSECGNEEIKISDVRVERKVRRINSENY